jgi:hypothetical protein
VTGVAWPRDPVSGVAVTVTEWYRGARQRRPLGPDPGTARRSTRARPPGLATEGGFEFVAIDNPMHMGYRTPMHGIEP